MKNKKGSGEFVTFILVCVVIVGLFAVGFMAGSVSEKQYLYENIDVVKNKCINYNHQLDNVADNEIEAEIYKKIYEMGCYQYAIQLMEEYSNE